MSTWKKASKINQKTHRERHQPKNRDHLGLLEKKKDYKQRANDANRKKKLIKILKKKALNKNPDEYHFHMVNSRMIDDTHTDIRKEVTHTPEQIKLMHTRDLKYITYKRTIEKNKIEKLQSELHLLDKANSCPNTHTFFVDSEEEAKNFDLAKRLNTHPALLHRRSNRPTLSSLEELDLPDLDEKTAKKVNSRKNKKYVELERRIKRERELAVIQRKLEIDRELKSHTSSPPVLIREATPKCAAVYKWKSERKK